MRASCGGCWQRWRVCVTRLAYASWQRHARALLHHVRGLVRGRAQIGRGREGNAFTRGVRCCAHRPAGIGGRAADVRLHGAHVVISEAGLAHDQFLCLRANVHFFDNQPKAVVLGLAELPEIEISALIDLITHQKTPNALAISGGRRPSAASPCWAAPPNTKPTSPVMSRGTLTRG
jgi:hypothetical protein